MTGFASLPAAEPYPSRSSARDRWGGGGGLARWLVWVLSLASASAVASDCEVTYRADTQEATLPCVRLVADGAVYAASLVGTDGLFQVTNPSLLSLGDAQVDEVQISVDPIPVVLAYIALPDSCSEVYPPAAVVVDSQAHSIAIRIRVVQPADGEACLAVTRSDVKAFAFDSLEFEPGGTTYSVDVNGVTASVLYDPLAL